jgi:TetR/AcrR family transcriptional regulator
VIQKLNSDSVNPLQGGKMGQAAMSRKAIEEESRREYIFSVSERLFAKKGLHETSVADIAREAEFGIGTLYKYFKDKNSLIASLLEARMNDHFDEVELALAAEGTPLERIEELMDVFLSSLEKRRDVFRVYFNHIHAYSGIGLGSLDLDFLSKRRREVLKKIESVFSIGIKSGDFADIDPSHLTVALMGIGSSFHMAAEHGYENKMELCEIKSVMKTIFFERVRIDHVIENQGNSK